MGDDDKARSRGANTTGAGPRVDAPLPAHGEGRTPAPASRAEIDAFVDKVRALGRIQPGGRRGRLIIAMDATMSRQPTWDLALSLQGEMFDVVAEIGGLDVQLVFFRGLDECRASSWVGDAKALARLMATVDCRGGRTQIRKLLAHARREAERQRVDALVYIGDCMEEDIDELCGRAGELALLKVPVFLFQEGRDATAATAFREIARLTMGATCSFGAGAADELRALLRAVATYASGGEKALARLADGRDGATARRLLVEMKQR